MVYIYGENKNIYFTVTLGENHTIHKSRCDTETTVKTGWTYLFGNSVRVIEQRFDISFREVLELQN
jgi:hypothetical protein